MNVFLETPRLILRQFTAADLDNLVTLDSDPDVMRFIQEFSTLCHELLRALRAFRFLGNSRKTK